MTNQEINRIKNYAAENFDGDIDLAIAAYLYSLWKVKKSAGIPVFADLDEIAKVRAEYESATGSLENDKSTPNDPQPLEAIKTEFSDQDVFLCAYEQSRSDESDLRLAIARAMFGESGVIDGELNPLANANSIGQIKARYTRLMKKNANAEETETSEQADPQTNATENAAVAEEAKPLVSTATEENEQAKDGDQNPPVVPPVEEPKGQETV